MTNRSLFQQAMQLGFTFGIVVIFLKLLDTIILFSPWISILIGVILFLLHIIIPYFILNRGFNFEKNTFFFRFTHFFCLFISTILILYIFEQSYFNYFNTEFKHRYAEKMVQSYRDKLAEMESKNNLKIVNKESSLKQKYDQSVQKFDAKEITRKYVFISVMYLIVAILLSVFYRREKELT